MRAILKPRHQSPHADEQNVTMIARTGNSRIKVEFNRGEVRAVDPWRLFAEFDRNRRITDAEFARLPWQGAGVDPLTLSSAELFERMEEVPR